MNISHFAFFVNRQIGASAFCPPPPVRLIIRPSVSYYLQCAALFAPVKGTSTPLWQQLVSQGRFTAEQFQAAFPADPYAALHTQSKYRTALAEKLQGVNNVTWMEETSACTIL